MGTDLTIKRISRILVWVLALQVFFPPTIWAEEKFDPHKISVAVLSHPSSFADKPLIEKTAAEIREKLSAIPYFRVVNPKTAQSLMGYHADYINKDPQFSGAERDLGLAKIHWFDRELEEALVLVDRALLSLKTRRGELYLDALLTKAVILKDAKKFSESKAVFEEALAVNPHLTMAGLPIVGRSRRVFNQTKSELVSRDTGGMEIKTNPPAAMVYLNGVRKGVTPLELEKMPPGNYLLTLEASHYQTRHEPITISANSTQFVNRKLNWVSGRSGRGELDLGVPVKSDQVIQQEIKKAVQIGETLKVDRVILVSSENKKGEALLSVRTIDTALKAAYNPIGLPFSELTKKGPSAIATVADNLDDQARKNILKNPKEYLEPNTGDIRVLRHKKAFFKTPTFFALMGLIVGGGVGTTLGIVLTRNNNTSNTIDEGGIEIAFQ